jgi:uncharacterized membrane protein YgcG
LLFDGKAGTEETAATLVDLAVRGAVRIEAGDGDPRVVLLDPAVAEHGHEQALLRGLFNPPTPGATRSLSRAKPGERAMYNAHTDTIRQVQHQVAERRWYTRPPTPAESSELSCLACMMVPVAAGIVGYIAAQLTRHVQDGVLVGIAGLVAGMSLVVLQAQRSRGRRSAAGRAVADQVVGFRTYLATAEADQLRFEEGEDIFGRYLPWAIVFGIADRWEAVCAELVAAGRLPAQTDWCVGETNTVLAFSSVMNDTLWSFAPPPMPSQASTSGSSSMFDSSSSFGGGGGSSSGFSSSSDSGGSSGGGGGGGGGDSW